MLCTEATPNTKPKASSGAQEHICGFMTNTERSIHTVLFTSMAKCIISKFNIRLSTRKLAVLPNNRPVTYSYSEYSFHSGI